MYPVNRKPIHVGYVEFQFGIRDNLFFDLLVQNFFFIRFVALGKCSDDSISLFTGHEKEGSDRSSSETYIKRIMRKIPVDPNVSDIEKSVQCTAAEFDSKRMSNHAFRSVASD